MSNVQCAHIMADEKLFLVCVNAYIDVSHCGVHGFCSEVGNFYLYFFESFKQISHMTIASFPLLFTWSLVDDQCVSLLEEFAKDTEPIVSQSCEVALSMLDYERSGKSFEVTNEQSKLTEIYLKVVYIVIDEHNILVCCSFSSCTCLKLSRFRNSLMLRM